MERSRLNLRIVDKWRPGKIPCQLSKVRHSQRHDGDYVEMSFGPDVNSHIFAEDFVSGPGHSIYPSFTKARITEDLALGFGFGKAACCWKRLKIDGGDNNLRFDNATYAVI